jgi:amino acid transporter
MFNVAFWVFYPGAHMELAAIIAVVGSLAVGITYGLFSAVYPRSGGEYVPLSRTTHPLIGFVAGFSQTIWQIFYFGINGAFAASIGFAPFLTVLGLQTGSAALMNLGQFFDSPVGWFVFSAVMIIFFSTLLYRGMRTYFSVQKYLFTIGLAIFVIFVLVLALGALGVFDFQGNFNKYAGEDAYSQLLSDASEAGVDLSPSFSFGTTLNFVIWPAFAYLFAVLSIAFSGEVKNVERGQLLGITGSQLIAGLLIILTTLFARLAIGGEFLRAVGFIGFVEPDKFPLPYPWLTLLGSIMADNILLTVLINLGIALQLWFTGASAAIYATRGLLAWGIDGMGPSALGRVSERYHSPTTAIWVTGVLALLVVAVYSFTDWLVLIAGLAPFAIVFMLTAFAGMIFPFTRRGIYEASPARIEIRGLPLMAITGFVGTIFCAFLVYRAIADVDYGANSPQSIAVMIGVFAIGAIWYFVARAVRRGQGVDMESRFEEIPIE